MGTAKAYGGVSTFVDDDDDFEDYEFALTDLEELDEREVMPVGADHSEARQAGAQQDDDDDLLLSDGSEWNEAEMVAQLVQAENRVERSKGARTATVTPALEQLQATAGPSKSAKYMPPSSSSGKKSQPVRGSGGGSRQLNLFGEVVPHQSSQGMLLVANRAHTAAGTASQRVRDALTKQNHRLHMEAKGKRKEWDRSQPLDARKSSSATLFDDDDDGSGNWGDADDDLMSAFRQAPPPPMPDVLKQMKVPIDRIEAQTWIYPTNKEKRDYQYNIVQRALFNNVLVALPTGLGKTFIAAVVILNYYRWFPTGKIIFVAPTKPLVAQQQQACHGICGLPWDCAVEMTGGTKASLRGDEWKTKRIFYMTPQTFENDLCSTVVDAEDVVCVVVDEAHRATGNYAYGKVIRWITARNPFFRVLALTATPGNKPDKVQEVIDNLHINLIEIRSEEAVDIRKYVHAKTEDPVVVPLEGVVSEMKNLFAKVMKPTLEVLNKNGLISIKDPCSLSPFAVTQINKDPSKRAVIAQRKLYNQISELSAMARAMEYLIRYSVHMFYQRLSDMQTGTNEQGKKAVTGRQREKFQSNTVIREIERIFLDAQNAAGKVRHPKMEYLQNVVAAHFSSEEGYGRRDSTRIMVFCQYRECVLEIVDILNEQVDIKATCFVGQSSDSKGNKGMRQKEQEQIVQDFKNGLYNVLVATSIGEEGLDIGEVDLIVCYEAVKNSVRMLQRIGRTGRKRDGRIVVLMSEGPEENFWQHSKDNHKTIQNELINGSHLELFDDVERIVPDDITCVAVVREVDQPPFEPSMIRAPAARREKKVAKAKRNSDPHRNVPEGGATGFIKVSDMRRRRKRDSIREGDSSASGSPAAVSESDSAGDKGMSDDSGDEELERGLVYGGKQSEQARVLCSPPAPVARKTTGRLGTHRVAREHGQRSSISRCSASSQVAIDLLSSSPVLHDATAPAMVLTASSPLQPSAINVGHSPTDDDGGVLGSRPSSPVRQSHQKRPHPLVAKLAAELDEDDACENGHKDEDEDEDGKEDRPDAHVEADNDAEQAASTSLDSPTVATRRRTSTRKAVRIASSSPAATNMAPPIRSSVTKDKSSSRKRVKRAATTTRSKKRIIDGSPTSRRLLAYEADRSTDEEVHGERDENDDGQGTDEADSSDLEHVGDFVPTQAPRGYKQSAVYLQSLQSQTNLTPFRERPRGTVRGFQLGLDSDAVQRYSEQGTPGDMGGEDAYEKDSFVCSDEDIAFDSDAEAAESSQL